MCQGALAQSTSSSTCWYCGSGRPGHAQLAGAVAGREGVERPGRQSRPPAPWWRTRSAPGAASPGRRRSRSSPRSSGTVTDSATAPAHRCSESFIPIRVDEQVGCSAIAGTLRVTTIGAAPARSTNATASTMRRRRDSARRRGHLALQHLPQTLGAGGRVTDDRQLALPADAAHSARQHLADHHLRSRPSFPWTATAFRSTGTAGLPGRCSVMPGPCAQICSNDSRTPGPASLGPNMVPTQAVKNTISPAVPAGSSARAGTVGGAPSVGAAGRRRAARPTTAAARRCSITLRPSSFGPVTSAVGTLAASGQRDRRGPGGPGPVLRRSRPALGADLAGLSARSRFIRSPVLISTGQAVWHIPSTAQVCDRRRTRTRPRSCVEQRGVARRPGPAASPGAARSAAAAWWSGPGSGRPVRSSRIPRSGRPPPPPSG